MEQVLVQYSTIENQNIAGGDILINHHYHAASITDNIKSVEFHFPKLIKSFAGRESEIKQLTDWFFLQNKKMVAVSGCPGYGKTELCKQFVRQCKKDNRITNILWMDAETPDKLMQSFKDLSKMLQLPDVDDQTLIQQIYQHFEENFPENSTFVVFDNAMNMAQIGKFDPEEKCLCLITCHEKNWGVGVPSLTLEPLSLDAALAVMRTQLEDLEHFRVEDTTMYSELAEFLNRVPLALQVAAAYVRQEILDLGGRFHLHEYIQELRISPENLIHKSMPDFISNSYKASIYQALNQSFRKIENIKSNHSKLALNILNLCSYFDTENIFSSIFLDICSIQKLLSGSEKSRLDDLTRALSLLQNYSLIRLVDNDRIIIHRLVQEILILHQNLMFQNDTNPYYFNCLEFLLSDNDNTHKHFICKRAEQHVYTFTKFYRQFKTKVDSTPLFLHVLINTGCTIFLNVILDELGAGAIDLVNTLCLAHAAVRCKQPGVVQMLLQRAAHANQRDQHGDNPLHLAADNLDLCIMEILAAHNADVNAVDAWGNSVLHRVIAAPGNPQHVRRAEEACAILRWLVQRGARTCVVSLSGCTLLHEAAQAHNADLVLCLVTEYMLDVNVKNEDDRTPLYSVSLGASTNRLRRLRTAECLLELGARRDVVDKWGWIPAQHARLQGLEYLGKYLDAPTEGYDAIQTLQVADELHDLIAAGNIQQVERKLDELGENQSQKIDEYCLLHVAARQGRLDVLELLLERGANINSRDDKNATALHFAVRQLQLDSIQLLKTRNANLNAVNVSGISVLHELVWVSGDPKHASRHEETCAALWGLVHNGARTDVVTPDNITLLHMAAATLQPDLVHCFVLEFKLDVHVLDKRGQTPLYWVCAGLQAWRIDEAQGVRMAACLLELGALTDLVNNQGRTPAQDARARGYNNLAQFLDDADCGQWVDADMDMDSGTITASTACLVEDDDDLCWRLLCPCT